jgi:excisionase family DNA binding protein
MADPNSAVPRLAFDIRQTAASLGVCTRTVLNLIQSGELHATKLGDKYVVRPEAIEKMLRRRRVRTR